MAGEEESLPRAGLVFEALGECLGEDERGDLEEFLRTGEPVALARFIFAFSSDLCKSSSDFFRAERGLSRPGTGLDAAVGLVYRLEVDFDLVSPLDDLTRLVGDSSDSNSFLVSFTVSGAGNSLFLTPNKTPADGGFWPVPPPRPFPLAYADFEALLSPGLEWEEGTGGGAAVGLG